MSMTDKSKIRVYHDSIADLRAGRVYFNVSGRINGL